MKTPRRASGVMRSALVGLVFFAAATVRGDTTPQTLPFGQDWTNTGLITVNDDWSGVPGVVGFLGDSDAGSPTAVDPQTLVADVAVAIDVIANQANPNTQTAGGVAEFHATLQTPPDNTNSVVALQGSGTADAPFVRLHLNTTGFAGIRVRYNLRDVDGSVDNAVQPVALQFRVGTSGTWTNVPAGFVADATTGPSLATLVTPVDAFLPGTADSQPEVQVRVITTNAVGSDEWVGIDDIQVTGTPVGGMPNLTINDATVTEGNAGPVFAQFTVSLSSPAGVGGVTFDVNTADGSATLADNDYLALNLLGQTIPEGGQTATFTVTVNGDAAVEPNETFFLNITNVTGANVVDGQGVGTITNDDFTITPIHDIQGPGNASPLAGQLVTTTGIVTGLKSNGFFIQAPDADADADPNTSEGVFVFTSSLPPPAAVIGNAVRVGGTVVEFIPSADLSSPPMTEISGPTVTLFSPGNPLPAPIPLTAADTNPAGPIEQLERREGMRVSVASLTVVHPTGGSVNEPNATSTSTGVFYGTLPTIARPFREAGIEAPDPIPSPPCCIPRFDGNPERLRVDSDAQPGTTAIEVTAGATVTGLVGPLDYGFRTYTILPEAATPPGASGNGTAIPVPVPAPDEFTVGSFNLERFFNDVNDPGISEPVLTPVAFANRLNKSSLAIRDVLRTPDILGVIEIENLATLQSLASKVNADAIAAGDPDPQYSAYLVEGNDIGGIDVGFLVKSSRVNVISVTQEGAAATYIDPNTGEPALLNDRPPLVLEAEVTPPAGPAAPVTVIVNHLRSLIGVDDPVDGNRVRAKRRAQAEFLAILIQNRQAADPTEVIVSVGDYNAFQVNDGYVDLIGTIKGTPTPSDNVILASPDLVAPNLVNLVDVVPASQKYSYAFDGNAQVLDHVIVSSPASALLTAFQYARLDADFPDSFRNDPNRPERLSDHDAAVAYFAFSAPSASVGDQTVTEGDGGTVPASFTVTLARASTQLVTVNYATQDGTAIAPADYQAATGTVTFVPGDTQETVTVNVVGDLLDENDETFVVNLSAPVNATLGDDQATGTILDNDPLPILSISDATAVEGDAPPNTNAVFTIAINAPSGRDISFQPSVLNGTATQGQDYNIVPILPIIPAGTTQLLMPVQVFGDALDELNENFFFLMANPVNATLGDNQGEGIILDDEIGGADFNADGRTDILWRQQNSGENVAWLMNGVTLASGTFTTPAVFADTGWKIAGTSDFNQDEQGDIFWQHAGSGEMAVWFMDGTTLTSGTLTDPPALADPRWKVYATGDFNGDGKPDLVWRHQTTGQIVMWFMDGATLTNGTFTDPSTLADLGWRIAASGDFNRDGKADIVWHHESSGEIAIWYMNGATLLSGTLTTPSALGDTQWKIVGSGDFNLDTRPDILWRHATSGQIVVWYMDNATLTSGTFTNPSALPDLNWQIVGPR